MLGLVQAVASGVLAQICATVKECLDKLPGDSRTQVGFMTFAATLHFYNLSPKLTVPQVLFSDSQESRQ
jgi:protein transport protein SEC24